MKTLFISRDGKKYDVVDFKERRKMCELCCYLLDLFPPKRHEARCGRTLEQLLEETYGKE